MWRIWLMIDPRRALIGMAVFLFALAIFIHFILLSTSRFNWIEGPTAQVQAPASITIETEQAMDRSPTWV